MTVIRNVGQALLGAVLTFAGITHLTVARSEFQAQVPDWFPLDADVVVLASGVVEITLGVALLTVWRQPARGLLGAVVAAFFIVIFPGNVAQWLEHKDGFGLDTDTKRFVRLFFQPLLVVWALAVTSAISTLRRRFSG
ncbi:DoxX family protein [Actinoplanes xinjiangensis]|uniref:DoxX family protein n=1 Tax=Actinoplanes xinjiangensis TaxID=512350 RepID=UPI00343711B1